MEKEEITCDTCGRDVSSTGNCVDYRISLSNVSLPARGSTVTAMMIYPPLEHNMDFCGLRCLKEKVATL